MVKYRIPNSRIAVQTRFLPDNLYVYVCVLIYTIIVMTVRNIQHHEADLVSLGFAQS